MTYVAMMNWDADGRGTKGNIDFPTLAKAQALASQGGKLPGTRADAFAVEHPGGGLRDLIANPINKTVTFSPLPVPPLTLAEKMAPYEISRVVAR